MTGKAVLHKILISSVWIGEISNFLGLMSKFIWLAWSCANRDPCRILAYKISEPGGVAVQFYYPGIDKLIHLIGMPYVFHSKHRCLFFNVTHFNQNLISSICPFNCKHFMEIYENFYGNSMTFRPNFFLLGGSRGICSINSSNLINIRHHLAVLLILAIFQIIWASTDLLWP